jgi:hypothetical protein
VLVGFFRGAFRRNLFRFFAKLVLVMRIGDGFIFLVRVIRMPGVVGRFGFGGGEMLFVIVAFLVAVVLAVVVVFRVTLVGSGFGFLLAFGFFALRFRNVLGDDGGFVFGQFRMLLVEVMFDFFANLVVA